MRIETRLVPIHCADDDFLPPRQANKPFKTKGMQLGGKGAKNKADLLDALGGAPVAEEAAPLMVIAGLVTTTILFADEIDIDAAGTSIYSCTYFTRRDTTGSCCRSETRKSLRTH